MELGISITSAMGQPWREGVALILERVRAASQAGLDTLSFGDHHVTHGYVQNTPMLARALAEWGDRPAGCLFLLPLWNPVLLAEQVATLSGMVGGPFILQTGIGDGAGQFAAMGATTSSRGKMADEAIRVIKALLAGDTVDSEAYGFTGAGVTPEPASRVDWWVGAGLAPAALRRAAREGDAWYGPPLTVANGPDAISRYRDACAEGDREPRVIIRKDVIILDDGSAAERIGTRMLDAGYRGMQRDQVAIGTPEQVAHEFAQLGDIGVEQIVIRCMARDQSVAVDTITAAGEVRRLMQPR